MIENQTIKLNGKLLISGEYVVLDGALSLALPTKFGQIIRFENKSENHSILFWEARKNDHSLWFSCSFNYKTLAIISSSDEKITNQLILIFAKIKELNQILFKELTNNISIQTQLEFPENWGLGSSSTLIAGLSKLFNINPYQLLELTFGGSGYDLACAVHHTPIIFQKNGNEKLIKPSDFHPSFKENLYFLYLNQKQNSREGIANYRSLKKDEVLIKEISNITTKLTKCKTLIEFNDLINIHEKLISNTLKCKTVKENLFSDFDGSIKSLGAWGGDFVLVTSEENPKNYFLNKGFFTLLKYKKMILNE